jgi:hypothetical protein
MRTRKSQPQKEPPPQPQPQIPLLTPGTVYFSQLDITQHFDDKERLGQETWASTVPLNASTPYPQARGLPPIGASDEDTYRIAAHLSQLRDSWGDPSDGVYCPVCHIANTELARLHTPCPVCNRALLRFGWS